MSGGPTLNSRLRILVAKAFRAEKLYSSANNVANNIRGEKLQEQGSLAEAVNNVRLKEWQKAYYQLRTALNEILGLSNNTVIINEITLLRDRFLQSARAGIASVEQGSSKLVETAERAEYSQVFRQSIDLIRMKAEAQACGVIADELSSIIESVSKVPRRNFTSVDGSSSFKSQEVASSLDTSLNVALEGDSVNSFSDNSSVEINKESAERSNVFLLKRRASGGKRR